MHSWGGIMYSANEITKALSECIQEMNTGLITDNNIQNSISLIRIKCALEEMVNIVEDGKLNASKNDIERIKKYVDVCLSVLNVYKNMCEIGTELYKEDYLSEETCRVIMSKFDYVLKRVSNILDNKNLAGMLYPFIDYVTTRINIYHDRIYDILDKGHIK